MPESPNPTPPNTGSSPAPPSASHYLPEMPTAEELETMLGGRYLVEGVLAQGGMAAVYKGVQVPHDRPVAIKVLPRQQVGMDEDLAHEQRFKREANIMAALTHPNIVPMHECGVVGEHFLFISMELMEGGDLAGAIKARVVTPELALQLIVPICEGLEAAHERGLVHRDIKPANIFLTMDWLPKVADFGLAKEFDSKSTFVTKTGLGMGTPEYAAPEQCEGLSDVDHRADIYALGVMFYQMLTGSLPRGAYKPASQHVDIDPRLDAVLAKAMAPDRNERYQSVAEMRKAVQLILSTPGVQAQLPTSAPHAESAPGRHGQPWVHYRRVPPMPPRTAEEGAGNDASIRRSRAAKKRKSNTAAIAGALAAIALVAGALFLAFHKPMIGENTAGAVGDTASATPVPPASANEKWVDGLAQWWAAPKHGDFMKEADGTARSTKYVNPMEAVALNAPLADQAVSVTAEGGRWDAIVRHSRAPSDGGRQFYSVKIAHNRVEFGLVGFGKAFSLLKSYPLATDFDPMASHTLEVRAVGQSFAIFLDGAKLGEVSHGGLSSGAPMVSADKGVLLKSFKYLDLDDASRRTGTTASEKAGPATPAETRPPAGGSKL